MQKKNLKDQRIGMLTVLREGEPEKQFSTWVCLCDCGKEKTYRAAYLNARRVRSCGCNHFLKGEQSPHWKGVGSVTGSILYRIRREASRRGHPFDMTTQYLWELFQAQDGKCVISGEIITLPKCREDERTFNFTASVDQIEAGKGYVPGNVQWVHKVVNTMKWDRSVEDLIDWCRKILHHNGVPPCTSKTPKRK